MVFGHQLFGSSLKYCQFLYNSMKTEITFFDVLEEYTADLKIKFKTFQTMETIIKLVLRKSQSISE